MKELIKEINQITQNELDRANEKFPLFHSPHEGYATIKEELEESRDELVNAMKSFNVLWEEIKHNESADILRLTALDLENKATLLACESTQLAAMSKKFIDSLMPIPRTLEDEGQALKRK